MASIIEGVNGIVKESFLGLKVLVWASLLCISAGMIQSPSLVGYIITAVIAVLFIGYLAQLSHNVIDITDTMLPGLNVLKLGTVGITTLAVLLPYVGLGMLVSILCLPLTAKIQSPVLSLTAQIMIYLLAISCIVSSYVLFIRRLNPFESFNLKKYFIGFFSVFISYSYLLIKGILLSCGILLLLAYYFYLSVGFQNMIWTFTMCILSVFILFIIANYMAQISEEIYGIIEKEEKERRERKAAANLLK